MQIDQLVRYLDKPPDSFAYLESLGLEDPARAQRILVSMAKAGLTLDLLANLCGQLERHLPAVSDPDSPPHVTNRDGALASRFSH